MKKTYFAIAILLTVAAVVAFAAWYYNSGVASGEPSPNSKLASQAFLIGIVSLITAIVSWYTAFRSP